MRTHGTLHWPPGPLLEEQVTRFKVQRCAVLAIGAVLALGFSTAPASASPTQHNAPPQRRRFSPIRCLAHRSRLHAGPR